MSEISVIIPVYNGAEFIHRCYDSIVEQEFGDIEIIFVDDESKDNSLEILRQIEKNDPRVKVIAQKNKRQGGARNTGVRAASGKYIAFVDIDDYISPDFLSGLHSAIQRYGCEIAASSVIRVKPNGRKNFPLKYDKCEVARDKAKKARLAYGNGTGRGIWNKLFLHEFLIKNNLEFREHVSYEDCDFCAKAIYYADSIVTTPVGNYFYYVNKNSTMRCFLDKKKQHDRYEGILITTLFELENGVVNGAVVIPKYDYQFFGINLLRIKVRLENMITHEEYWLFDFIKIFRKKIKIEKL